MLKIIEKSHNNSLYHGILNLYDCDLVLLISDAYPDAQMVTSKVDSNIKAVNIIVLLILHTMN